MSSTTNCRPRAFLLSSAAADTISDKAAKFLELRTFREVVAVGHARRVVFEAFKSKGVDAKGYIAQRGLAS